MRLLLILLFVTSTWAKPYPQFGQFLFNAVNTGINIARNAFILRFDNYNPGTGAYHYNVETSDGFKKSEAGGIRNAGTKDEFLAVTGHYSYLGKDGKLYDVKYTADENGFQPEGEHIPPSAGVKKPKLGVNPHVIDSLVSSG